MPTGPVLPDTTEGSLFPVRFRPSRRELGEVTELALPIVAVQLGLMAMGVVDTVMVGHYAGPHLAAVALGNLYFFTAVVFPVGVLLSLDPLVAQAVGAGDSPAAARAMQRGLLLAVLFSLPAGAVLMGGEYLLPLLGQPPEVVPVASRYARATAPGVLPYLAFVVFRQGLQAIGRVSPLVTVIALANVANVLLNWLLVFGRFGFPELGAEGTGWASTLCRWGMALGVLAVARPWLARSLTDWHPEVFKAAPAWGMIRLGTPIGLQFSLEFGAFGAIGVLMGWLGAEAMAGHQVALNLASLTFMVPLGVAQAAAVLVGRAIGKGDLSAARRSAGAALLLAVGFMAAMAVLFLSIPRHLARLYSPEGGVVEVAASLLPLAGLFQVFDGTQVVASGILRGTGDTRLPMFIHLMGFWAVGMPLSVGLGFWGEMGPRGLWWGLVGGLGAVAFFLGARVGVRLAGPVARLRVEGG